MTRTPKYDGFELVLAFVTGVLLTVVTWLLVDQVLYHHNCKHTAVSTMFDNERYCIPDDVLIEYKD